MSLLPGEENMSESGVFYDVPFGQYQQWAGISRSRLWTLYRRTPAHFRYEMDHPEDVETVAMQEGSAIHAALLEPDRFAKTFIGGGPINDKTGAPFGASTKKFAEWGEAQAAKGLTALPRADFDYYESLNAAVHGHPVAGTLLGRIKHEVSIQWRHPETGLLLRGRLDGLGFSHDKAVIVELKSCLDASAQRFGSDAYRYGYLFQVAMYADGVRAAAKREVEQVVIMAVEKNPPYGIALYRVDTYQLDLGRDQVTDSLRQVALCERYGDWPGYEEGLADLYLPGYAGQEWSPFADGLEQVLIKRAERAGRPLPETVEKEPESLGL